MAHTINPSASKTEANRSLWIWGQPQIISKFQLESYTVKLILKSKIKTTTKQTFKLLYLKMN